MRRTSTLMLAAPILIASVAAVFAHAPPVRVASPPAATIRLNVAATDASPISLEHVWSRASAGNATTGAAYLTVTSTGQPDRLVSVSTPAAAMAELHESINDNGVMKMRSVASIPLAPGKPVTLQPGGAHIMLMGLKSPLKAGDTFPLTLTFEHAPPITVMTQVEAIGARGTDHAPMSPPAKP